MNASLVGAGVGATIQVVLQNLLSGSIEKIKLVWDLEEDLTDLVDSLFMVHDFLSDAEMKQINSKAVQHWLHQLEDLAFEADAVVDEFNYELLRQEVEKQKQHDHATNVFTDLFISGPANLLLRNEMANKVNKLNKKFIAINERAEKYGLNRAVVEASSNVGLVTPQVQTDSISEVPNFIGRNEDVLKIVDMLISTPCNEPFSVIPILGMGGIGKTTLVQKVFYHERIRDHFDEKIWVCVSVDFDVLSLLKMILEILTGETVVGFERKEVVMNKIRENLAGKKRYLLVLDDVWNESPNEWSPFMSSLLGTRSVDGNCIVVTTRNEKVASNVRTFPAYQLSSLVEDDCWLIIKAITFSNVVPREYEEIGKCIAQRCAGLPLAAKVVGGLLRNKSKAEWESMKTQILKFGLDDDYVMKILKLSYDHLPSSSSKKCFAYCSVFPQDHELEREELIMLWMAEGFLHDESGNDMEKAGDIIFNHIFQSSLFHDAERDEYGNIEFCRMHDLVHDLARAISGDRTICKEDDRSNIVNRVRYFSRKADSKDSRAILKKQGEYMRTIFVEGNIAVNMIAGFKRLHALKLTCRDMKELPNEIGELIRYLLSQKHQ